LGNKLIDGVIKEPIGGAHTNPEEMFGLVKKEILKHLPKLMECDKDKLVTKRINKFCSMGVINE
jgi:acetyl-CoA carboxylase carboxyl transferase subunit alpha